MPSERKGILGILAAALALLWLCAGAFAEEPPDDAGAPGKRLAIVIGNGAYTGIEPLRNAPRDADAIAARLERLGFAVRHATDLTRSGFESLVAGVEAELPGAEALVVFYSGHGFQLGHENYLVPTDFDPGTPAEAIAEAVPLGELIRRLSSPGRPTLIFLDACRNNPLPASVVADTPAGLAQVETGDNLFIAFATEPGKVSYDGGSAVASGLSPFSDALARSIEQPGLSASDLVIAVRNATLAVTRGEQRPWDQSSLLQQFYFTEHQRLDPALLIAGLQAVDLDPERRRRLREELAADPAALQRIVVALADSAAAPPAAAAPPLPAAEAKTLAATDLQALIAAPATGDAGPPVDLVKTVQGELSRLGCYRMPIDGVWGPGSRKALADFHARTRRAAGPLEPTVEILSELYLQPGRVCRAPVPIVRTSRAETPAATGRSGGGTARSSPPRQPAPPRAPAPLPPGVSTGIGIGGVF